MEEGLFSLFSLLFVLVLGRGDSLMSKYFGLYLDFPYR